MPVTCTRGKDGKTYYFKDGKRVSAKTAAKSPAKKPCKVSVAKPKKWVVAPSIPASARKPNWIVGVPPPSPPKSARKSSLKGLPPPRGSIGAPPSPPKSIRKSSPKGLPPPRGSIGAPPSPPKSVRASSGARRSFGPPAPPSKPQALCDRTKPELIQLIVQRGTRISPNDLVKMSKDELCKTAKNQEKRAKGVADRKVPQRYYVWTLREMEIPGNRVVIVPDHHIAFINKSDINKKEVIAQLYKETRPGETLLYTDETGNAALKAYEDERVSWWGRDAGKWDIFLGTVYPIMLASGKVHMIRPSK